jgi:hypothetical protein
MPFELNLPNLLDIVIAGSSYAIVSWMMMHYTQQWHYCIGQHASRTGRGEKRPACITAGLLSREMGNLSVLSLTVLCAVMHRLQHKLS